jgi:GNAT superfamily N-acetyltransferase
MPSDAPTSPTSERALEAALPVFARAGDGGSTAVHDEGDLRRIATGRPYASFNHIYAVRLRDPGVEARIAAVGESMRRSRSVPATWWIGPSTRPADLGRRLAAAGLREEEPESGMVIDPADPRPRTDAPSGVTVGRVTDDAGLRDWIAVMDRAYGWADRAKADAVLAVYRSVPASGRPWIHLVARVEGEPAACGSVFLVDGQAFVTNIGTVPAHRGRGLGSLVTSALLDLVRDLGHREATLTASVMGRSMYARLGFREDARFERYILDR